MRLASLEEFRRAIFTPGSAPSIRTLRARIRAGKIAGGMIEAGRYYVDMDAYEAKHRIRAGIIARINELQTDPRLQGLI